MFSLSVILTIKRNVMTEKHISQALIKEDKLLARIELLENQLEIFTRVSKNYSDLPIFYKQLYTYVMMFELSKASQ